MVVEYLVDPKYNLEYMELKTNMLNVLEQEVLLIFIQWHAIKKMTWFLGTRNKGHALPLLGTGIGSSSSPSVFEALSVLSALKIKIVITR